MNYLSRCYLTSGLALGGMLSNCDCTDLCRIPKFRAMSALLDPLFVRQRIQCTIETLLQDSVILSPNPVRVQCKTCWSGENSRINAVDNLWKRIQMRYL